jgi:hypothetical protein
MRFLPTKPVRWVSAAVLVAAACSSLVWLACSDDDENPVDGGGPPPPGLVDPIWEYDRSDGASVTGGYVYRGPSLPALTGKYIYSDYTSRHVWALSYDGATVSNQFLFDAPTRLSAFGVAEDGELFMCGHNSATATKIRGISESGGVYSATDPFPNLTFDQPVDLKHAGDGTNRLFVVEQQGFIKVFDNDAAEDTLLTFLDISGPVLCCGERGLLGLAFHPDYESNGYFYVYYTTPGSDVLSRFQVSADPNAADLASEKIMIEVPDREGNHNGGGLLFGPDGYLYLSTGDEGGSGDPYDNAQNRAVVYGKILRIDVDQNVNTEPYYGIPLDNPFVGNTDGFREEIYAWGFRNPWRISYDVPTGRLWVADVGQDKYEEIDIVEKGKNYGWDCREGKHSYTGDSSPICP